MRCPQCDSVNPETSRFCAACGARLTGNCPACAAEVGRDQRYCASCGQPLSRVSEAVADGLEGSPGQPSERRLVSVMFVDLAGFTRIAEAMDAEEVRGLQEQYFGVARAVVDRYGGTLEKFIGDAVMAFWGAPRAHEDDAERAVKAALDVVGGVGRLHVGRRRLKARAAVMTGEAAVTLGASGQGMLAGDLVNTAARLQQAAPTGSVLVDDTTRRLLAETVAFDPAGKAVLKGKTGALTVWRVRPGHQPGDRGRSAGHPGPFVGRLRELDELVDLYRRAIADRRSRLVSIMGIAGIGKSRLTWELARRLEEATPQPIVLTGHAPPYGEGLTFAPLAEVVARFAGIEQGGRARLVRRRLSSALKDYLADERERDWLEPRVAALLQHQAGASFEREELFAAWRRLFERVSTKTPVVLVFEDMQWADAALLDFIDHLAIWARDHPLLVITLARPELLDAHPTWGADQPRFTAIHLGPLPRQAMTELLTSLAPSLPPPALAEIVDRSGGVPLYGVEVARMLAGGDEMAGRGPVAELIPESLHSLVSARIDALPALARRVLLASAALGQRFSQRSLAAVAGLGPDAVRDGVELLVRRELLAVDDEPASPNYGQLTFVQQVVRDIAYRTLSRRQRRELHLVAADLLARQPSEVLVEPVAEHLFRAHQALPGHPGAAAIAARALPALRQAAARANSLHSAERALTHLERALEVAPDDETRAELWPETAATALAAARFELAEMLLRRQVGWHATHGRKRDAARARAQLASLLLTTERHASAVADLEAALGDIADLEQDPVGVELAGQLARGRMLIGDDAQGLEWARRTLAAARRLGWPGVAVDALITQGTARVHLGRAEAGLSDLREAVAEATGLGLVGAELRARNNLAWMLVLDDPHATMETARAGLERATEMGFTSMAVQLSEVTSAVAVETGEWDLALSILDDVREWPQAPAHRIQFVTTEAILRALRGDVEQAATLADGLEPIDAGIDPQIVAGLERARAWICFARGDFGEAQRRARAAANRLLWADRVDAWLLAGRAALWLGDGAGLTDALAALRDLDAPGRVAEAARHTLEAGAAALAGDAAAAATYEAAIAEWRALRMPLQLALSLAERDRWTRSATDEAAAILRELRAEGLLQLMHAVA